MTDLSVVIVSYNTRNVLAGCLESLAAHPSRLSCEYIVVDNHSTDGSPSLVRERWPDVRLIELPGNRGFAAANNVGMRESTGELILLLNSDTVVPDGALDELARALRERPRAAAVGPRIVDAEGHAELSLGRLPGPWEELKAMTVRRLAARGHRMAQQWIERSTSRPRAVDWVTGACLLVRRQDAEAVGWLDERYFMYFEDAAFCAALRALGREVWFVPEPCIVHLRGRSASTAPGPTAFAYRRSQLTFYARHHPGWLPWVRLYLRVRGKFPPPAADNT